MKHFYPKSSFLRTTYFLMILSFISSCSEDKLSPLLPGDTILAFGDSLTYGVGSKSGSSYPDALSEITGLDVVNAGISREVTNEGLKRFKNVLLESQASLVILMEGGNDILRNKNLTQTKNNLAAMIQTARDLRVEVILIGVPEKKLFSDSAPFYFDLAKEYDLVFDGEILGDLLRSNKYKSDPIHLNSAGYRKLAERIVELLEANGAI